MNATTFINRKMKIKIMPPRWNSLPSRFLFLSFFVFRGNISCYKKVKRKKKKHFSWRITLMFHWHCKKESLLFVVWIVFGQFCIIDHFGCSTQIKPWSKPISLQTYWKLYQYAKASACLLTNRAYKPSLWMSSICFPICIDAQR